eukprot:TRINITY_DN20859_c0_g1_i1.p1 TRINITY_DN20859_c0_g1~~TRINITY_DN20859_c0_g1_i1.p1  ORF type:complete len:600 (+),score=225.16 TRINITY_DN20859_c0_g1_i1:53-1801(+)
MPSRKRKAEEEEDVEEEEEEEESPGWGAYIVGNARITDPSWKTDRNDCLAFPVCIESFNELGVRPIAVASGGRHTLIVGDDRKVYGWGFNFYGQLGLDPKKIPYTYEWVVIKQLAAKRITKIACGDNHSLFLSEHGLVYSAGLNDMGQLGGSRSKAMRYEANLVKLANTKDIACGGRTSFALDAEGDVYVWGDAAHGHVGLGPASEEGGNVVDIPTKVPIYAENDDVVEQIVAGPKHSIARSGATLFACGNGEWGRLGTGDTYERYVPTKVKLDTAEEESNFIIGCSHDASYCVTTVKNKKGEPHTLTRVWGRVASSGNESRIEPVELSNAPDHVTKISGGKGWHMCLADDGTVYKWGVNKACSGMGVFGVDNTGSHRVEPQPVFFNDMYCSDFSCAYEYAMLFVDYSKSEGDHTIKVPMFGRLGGQFQSTIPFEQCRKLFLTCCEENQRVDADDISEASLDGPDREVKGASNLRIGDDVSLWVTNVWAWAKIKDAKGNGKFSVAWVREDWPKLADVELLSEDEDPDGESENRWVFGLHKFWDDVEEEEEEEQEDDDDQDDDAEEEEDEVEEEPAKGRGRRA